MKNLISKQSVRTNYHTMKVEDEILYLNIEPVDPTRKGIEDTMNAIRKLNVDNEHLILVDPTNAKVLSKDLRRKIVHSFNDIACAVAFLNTGFIASLMINFMIKIDKPAYPMKAFSSRVDAVNWLNTFKSS